MQAAQKAGYGFMLENVFEQLYLIFRANYYKRMVEKIGTRDGSLSSTEHYCVEIIYLLQKPTVSEFAQFLNISVPNANYKVSNLVDKGYVIRVPSKKDKREFHLTVTNKFLKYYGLNNQDNAQLMKNIRQSFTPEELEQLEESLIKMLALMQNPPEEALDD